MIKKIKILIVEDEALLAMLYRKQLERHDCEISGIAASGPDAISMAHLYQPDLVLMDIKLKGEMDGIDAAIKIRENLQIPIIYITGNTDDNTKSRALQTKPLKYLEKPVESEELWRTIEKGIGI
jgi:CheY-like chemotaxis protein